MNRQQTKPGNHANHRRSAQQGVALLEALVAILLFSMGVLAVVGLQAAMIKNTSDSKYRSEASYIAQQWIGQMWADPTPANQCLYLIPDNTDTRYDISSLLPGGTRTVTQPGALSCPAPAGTNYPFVITITWQQPGQDQTHTLTTNFSIQGG